jgi:CRP/FNR family cyclic AMP-dependent transcriptional regulator
MTAANELSGMFTSHNFLHGLEERHRLLLASGARPFKAGPGQLLLRQGQEADAFYLIQSGQVALSLTTPRGEEVPIQNVGPGEVVGWSWLVPPHRWQFNGRPVQEVQGIAFNAQWLRDLCERDYSLGYHLLRQLVAVMAERLAATRRQLTGQGTSA